jgi:hypothetical protein
MIVIPAPPGSQVASYDADEDGRTTVGVAVDLCRHSVRPPGQRRTTHSCRPDRRRSDCGNRPGYRMGVLTRDHPVNDRSPFFTRAR